MKSVYSLFAILLFLTACAPAAQPIMTDLPQASESAITPEADNKLETPPLESLIPTEVLPTASPTVPAVTFPLDFNDSLPTLNPITQQNADKLIPVAQTYSAGTELVQVSEDAKQVVFLTKIGVQRLDTESFTLTPFIPINTWRFARAISPNGNLVAYLGGGAPNIWYSKLEVLDLTTNKIICSDEPIPLLVGRQAAQLVFHGEESITLRFYTNDSQYRLMRWELPGCNLTFDQTLDTPVYAFSPDGETAALGEGNKLYLAKTNGNDKSLFIEVDWLLGAYFLPDGESLLVTTRYANKIYDLSTGEEIANLPANMGTTTFVRYTFSPDKTWLSVIGDGQGYVIQTEERLQFSIPSDVTNISSDYISSDKIVGDHLITSNYIWALRTRRNVGNLREYGFDLAQKDVVISGDGAHAVAGPRRDPFKLDVLDLSTGSISHTLKGWHTPVALPDGSGFIATQDGITGFFDYTSGEALAKIDLSYAGGKALENGTLLVWDAHGVLTQIDPAGHAILNHAPMSVLPPDSLLMDFAPAWAGDSAFDFDTFLRSFLFTPFFVDYANWMEREALSHNQSLLIRQTEKASAQLYAVTPEILASGNVGAEKPLAKLQVPNYPSQFVFSPDDTLLAAVVYGSNQILILEAQTGKLLFNLSLPYPVRRIYDLSFTQDNSRLLISASEIKAGEDDSPMIWFHSSTTLRVFDLTSRKILHEHILLQPTREEGCHIAVPFALTADGKKVITLTPECRLGVYNLDTWEVLDVMGGPYSWANIDLAISPDDSLLAMAYQDKLELWDLSSGTLFKSYINPADRVFLRKIEAERSFIYQVSFSPDGKLLGTRFGNWGFSDQSIITLWGVP